MTPWDNSYDFKKHCPKKTSLCSFNSSDKATAVTSGLDYKIKSQNIKANKTKRKPKLKELLIINEHDRLHKSSSAVPKVHKGGSGMDVFHLVSRECI